MHARAELIAIPDLHFPWAHDRALRWVIDKVEKFRPRFVVQLGDLYDQYCFSRYPRNPNVMTPENELKRGLQKARKMWQALVRASPESERFQLLGNHDVRFQKRLAERMPELQGILKLDVYGFPGVKSLSSDREDVELRLKQQNVICLHGWMTQPGSHLDFFGKSVVFGHLHKPHLIHRLQRHGAPVLFELNCGHLADPRAPVFEYGGTVRRKWELGFGLVDENGRPDFVGYPR